MSSTKKFIYTLLFAALNGFACAVVLKGGLGMDAWDSLSNTLGIITNIKVGTVGIIVNGSCIIGEYLILKKDFKKLYLLQILPVLVFGVIINFFYYDVLKFEVHSYLFRIFLVLAGFILSSFSVGGVTKLDIITFPLEAFCMSITRICKLSFAQIRQLFDVFSIIVSLLLCFIFGISLTVREGTVIGMLIYAPLMQFFMNKLERFFN